MYRFEIFAFEKYHDLDTRVSGSLLTVSSQYRQADASMICVFFCAGYWLRYVNFLLMNHTDSQLDNTFAVSISLYSLSSLWRGFFVSTDNPEEPVRSFIRVRCFDCCTISYHHFIYLEVICVPKIAGSWSVVDHNQN